MNHDDLPSELLDQLPTQQTLNFEYGILEAETRRVVQQRTNEIKTLMRRSSQDIIDIGHNLIEVKQHLGHGSFRNWLKFEFNWSVSAATKFMQVAEQFKCVKFTHLNITASTLYLIAAPSTPKEVREEILERASNGENIGYIKAKAIVCQHRKTASLKSYKPVNVTEITRYETTSAISAQDLTEKEDHTETRSLLSQESKPDVANVTEITRYETTSAISAQEDLTEKEDHTETRSLLSQESKPDVAFEDKQIATTIKDIPDDTTQTPTSIENQVAISHETSDAAIAEMAISIKNLTPQQLARVVIEAANKGLSEYHLSAIIMASQQALKTRQQFGDSYERLFLKKCEASSLQG